MITTESLVNQYADNNSQERQSKLFRIKRATSTSRKLKPTNKNYSLDANNLSSNYQFNESSISNIQRLKVPLKDFLLSGQDDSK